MALWALLHAPPLLLHTLTEYVTFIALLGSMYAITGALMLMDTSHGKSHPYEARFLQPWVVGTGRRLCLAAESSMTSICTCRPRRHNWPTKASRLVTFSCVTLGVLVVFTLS